jgi:hypothetical protein
MSKINFRSLTLVGGLAVGISMMAGKLSAPTPEVAALDPVVLKEIERKPASIPSALINSDSPVTAFKFTRNLNAKLDTKSLINLNVEGIVWMNWSTPTHARVSFRLADGHESTIAFEATFKSGYKLESIQAAKAKNETEEDELNVLKDFVSSYAFENLSDTTGEYTAKFSNVTDGVKKSKLAYVGTSKATPKIVKSLHAAAFKPHTRDLLSLEGSEETLLTVSKTSKVETESSYKIISLSPVPAHAVAFASAELQSEDLTVRQTRHTQAGKTWVQLQAALGKIRSMNSTERLALFHELVKSLKDDPESLAKFKSWLDDHKEEAGMLTFGIGVLASVGTQPAQQSLMDLFKANPASQHMILNALATSSETLSPETRDFVRQLADGNPQPDIAEHAALTLGAAIKNDPATTPETADEARLTKLFQTATTADEKRTYLDAIGNSGDAGFIPVIDQTLANNSDVTLREKAVFAARFMNATVAQPLIEQGMSDASESVQLAAVRAIAYQPSVKPYEPALKKCSQQSGALGKACVNVLASEQSSS